MKKEDLIKQLTNLAPETQDMLLEMLIDIKHSKEGTLGNSRLFDLEPNQELNLFPSAEQAKEYTDYISATNCDQIILNAVLKYHLVTMGANSIMDGKATIDAVCKYGYQLTVPQIHAIIHGMDPEEAKKTIAGSIFDNNVVDSNGLEMNKKDVEPLINTPPIVHNTTTNEPLNATVTETPK